MFKVLEGFHHILAWWIVGITDRRAKYGEWEYLPVAGAMEAAGLWKISEEEEEEEVEGVDKDGSNSARTWDFI